MMNSKTASTPEKLLSLQKQFAAHIRNPETEVAPADVEDRRMGIYRNLFISNVRSLLSWNFPVLKKIYSEAGWDALTRDFYVAHRAKTPLFPELPREFLQYLQEHRESRDEDPPFLLELAHYEWVSKALSFEESEIDEVAADPSGDLLTGVPVLSPLAWPLSYNYPVHKLGPRNQPKKAPGSQTHLLVYRNRADEVKFMEINAVSVMLLHSVKEDDGRTGQEILNDIVTALAHPNPQVVISGGAKLLEDFRERDVILGTRP